MFKQWMLSLCGATAITGIFNIFLSNSNLKKSINVFLSIFVLFYTLIPLSKIEFNDFQYDFNNIEFNEVTEEGYEKIIVSSIKEVCSKNSVEVISVDVDSYISDKYLFVNEIVVKIDESEKSKAIEGLLESELGFEVTVN